MAKYVSTFQNQIHRLCFNDENKNYLLTKHPTISFITLTDDQYNIIKYDSHVVSIVNNQLVIGDALFEPEDSDIEEGKIPSISSDEIYNQRNKLVQQIIRVKDNNILHPLPSEWDTIIANLESLNLGTNTSLRGSNWVHAVESNGLGTIRGYKEI